MIPFQVSMSIGWVHFYAFSRSGSSRAAFIGSFMEFMELSVEWIFDSVEPGNQRLNLLL